jgi:hypothetical protein
MLSLVAQNRSSAPVKPFVRFPEISPSFVFRLCRPSAPSFPSHPSYRIQPYAFKF